MTGNDSDDCDTTNDDHTDNPDITRRAAHSPLLSVDDFRPLSASVQVEVGANSRRGTAQRLNNDHYLILRLARQQEIVATSLNAADLPSRFEESGYAMLVADGLGEAGSGSVASRVALSTITHLALHCGRWNLRVDSRTAREIVERAEWFYAQVDAAVSERRRTGPLVAGMATALTAAYSAGDVLFVAHVGQSCAFLFREGALLRLTRDRRVDPLGRGPVLAAVNGRTQDLGHILSDALGGPGGKPSVEVEQFRLMNGDAVLLCTNGLTDVVDDNAIADVLATRRQPADQCAILTELAVQAGGPDNITAVLAQYQVPAS